MTRPPAIPRTAWLAFLLAPVAWVGQLLTGYTLEKGGCSTGDGGSVGGATVDAVTVAVTVAALAVAVTGVVLGARRRRAGRPAAFLADLTVAGGALLALLIVFGGVAALALDPCRAS
ncbi:MAG: hypothetical protein IT200_00255 [Thermoleophilia bacterium]|nr:hypothetical protein [Thermoleophilia bacterium]